MTSNPDALGPRFSRRAVLGAGLSVSFLGFPGPADAAARRRKLVVLIARGAMDGLSLAPPIGDPDYAALRGAIAIPPDQALKLDGTFALHPKLQTLHGMVQDGEARIAPAVALPEHIRSHFEAQDLLETGGARQYAATTGWLNRAVQALATPSGSGAISIGAQEPLILRGPARAQSWSPGPHPSAETGRIAAALQDLYAGDRLLGPALATGLHTEDMAMQVNGGQPAQARDARGLADMASRFMLADGGPAIAVMSLDGFDTHAGQGAAQGQLANRFAALDQVFDGLKSGLGPAWRDTVVVVVTEFGRTARVNGTQGTDHGTASAMILAGGALKPGGVIGDWPTLAQPRLFENRDLAPTLDVRSVFKGILRDHLGVEARALDATVFPSSANAPSTPGLVAA
jgi:uncharacterized protein (DUF1501 family)